MIVDNDLLSIQQARILAENAFTAQKKMAVFTQEQLDAIVECVAEEVAKHTRALAIMSHEETDYGKWQDKWLKNQFVCHYVRSHLRNLRCVGVIATDEQKRTQDIGVPLGVITALCPITSPVSTTIHNTLVAIKSGNAIIFSPHPRALKSISTVLDIIIAAAQSSGLPEGCISYLNTVTKGGTLELINHPAIALVMLTGDSSLLQAAQAAGKAIIYGGTGNGPAFIERSADVRQAVKDIIASKTFDNGLAPSAEQSIVVDAPVAQAVKQAMLEHGAYFLSEEESCRLAALFFCQNGRRKAGMAGQSAFTLAQRAGISVPAETSVLVAERKYISDTDPYSRELLSPVLAYYIEDDWEHACEKCLELLLHERNAHTLVIHSSNEAVIHQFALKKPVGRLLVNTPAAFGGMGATTNLFPSVVLGSGSAGLGITAENVSPLNLIYIRKVGYGVRQMENLKQELFAVTSFCQSNNCVQSDNDNLQKVQTLHRILIEAIGVLDKSSGK